KAKERLNSKKGKEHRSKRPIEVEAVFGQLKSNNKFTRFTLKGLEKIQIEFGLMALAHNLRKLSVKQQNTNPKPLVNNYKSQKNAVFVRIDPSYKVAA
ncbi:Transposase DDE domain-containing protein, partial [Paenimyroides aquimaris]